MIEFGNTISINQLDQIPTKKFLLISHQSQEPSLVALSRLDKNHGTIRIGRADDNDIVIKNPIVSNYHATLQQRPDGCYIIDGQDRTNSGQYRSSTNGLYFKWQRIEGQRKLYNGNIIRILDSNQYTVTLIYYDDINARDQINPIKLDEDTITIGRNENNDLVLNSLTVSSYHAKIEHSNNQHIVIHESNTNPTYLNGKPVVNPTPLKLHAVLKIGPFDLVYDGTFLTPVGDTLIATPNAGTQLAACNLRNPVKNEEKELPRPRPSWLQKQGDWLKPGDKPLLDDISLLIQPGEFVALVGPSGAGKSTLLDALNGVRPVNEAESKVWINGVDLYANFDIYREGIGYVPQQDIIHENLTVKQALKYVANLRGIPRKQIDTEIKKVLNQVALKAQKDTLVKKLSGGQKKRVNIAVELIANPPILFLDEPTSGLDPGLDRKVMERLKELATDGRTIVLVTHATENIDDCDKVAFLANQGRLAFYGTPDEARKFFDVSKFSEIYVKIDQDDHRSTSEIRDDTWPERFRNSKLYKKNVKPDLLTHLAASANTVDTSTVETPSLFKKIYKNIQQSRILSQRYLSIILSDKNTLFTSLLMAPLVALLLFVVVTPGLFSTLTNMASDILSVNQVLFMMASVATFFGLFSSIQEIVKEKAIYNRERLVNLSIPAYVFSKLIILSIFAIVQSVLLIYILDWRAEFPDDGLTSWSTQTELIITFFLTIFAATCLGLFISATVSRNMTLVVLVALVTVQILFGGVTFEMEGISKYLTWLTFTRWSTEAMGSSVGMANLPSTITQYLFLEFGDKTYLLQRWGILIGYALLFIGLTTWQLRRQDITKRSK